MDAMSGEQITALETGDAFVKKFGYPYFVTHRADLLEALLKACRQSDNVTLSPSKDVTDVELLPAGARVTCTDDSVYECDALIGADGLRSRVRTLLVDDGEPVSSAYVAYRGTVPMPEMKKLSGFGELDEMIIWAGPGLHLVQYPVRRGELCNQVAVFHSKAHEAGATEWGTVEELDEAFADVCPAVAGGVSKIDRSRHWQLFDRLPIDGWSQGHVTLLGDAAHPMLQYLAQGACQALEDSAMLAESVQAHGGDAVPAFKAYEAVRAPRTARVQTSARLFGDVLHIDGVGASMRSALLRMRAHDDFSDMDWLYGYVMPTL
jgi:salicylate hydroxylase